MLEWQLTKLDIFIHANFTLISIANLWLGKLWKVWAWLYFLSNRKITMFWTYIRKTPGDRKVWTEKTGVPFDQMRSNSWRTLSREFPNRWPDISMIWLRVIIKTFSCEEHSTIITENWKFPNLCSGPGPRFIHHLPEYEVSFPIWT